MYFELRWSVKFNSGKWDHRCYTFHSEDEAMKHIADIKRAWTSLEVQITLTKMEVIYHDPIQG